MLKDTSFYYDGGVALYKSTYNGIEIEIDKVYMSGLTIKLAE